MFPNNTIDLICIIYYLSKAGLNCIVVVKTSFWEYGLSLKFTKVLKIYAIIFFVNITDLKPPFCIVIWSASGDTDILILIIYVLYKFKHHTTIDSVSAKTRKNIWLGAIELREEYCLALVWIYALSGNDYISTFFKKGKEKILEDYWEISRIFILL